MRLKLLFTIKILLFAISISLNGMSVDEKIADILLGDKAKVSEACTYLSKADSSNTYAFIDAFINGRLCVTKDGQGVEKRDDGRFYSLYPIAGELISTVNANEVKQIKASRKDRLAFSSILPIINLNSYDAQTRSKAYKVMASNRDTASILHIEKALAKETDAEIKLLATNTLNILFLFGNNEAKQTQAVRYFASMEDDIANHQLYCDYLRQENILQTNRKIMQDKVDDIEIIQQTNDIFQNLFSGISLGSILVLIALGLSIIYGLAGVINMSHGEFLMIGAYTTYGMQLFFEKFLPPSMFDWAFFLSLPVSFVVTALFGLLIERLVIRHLYAKPLESLLATLGISLILIQLARNIFGDLTTVKAPAILSGGIDLGNGGLMLPYNRLFIICLTLVIVIVVYNVFQRTRLGVKIRAVTQNRNMSASVGISTKRVDMVTFMIGSGLAGVAGCAVTLIGNVVPNMGQTYIVDSFLVVVTGGVGKLAGCVTSGMGIGVLSKIFEVGFEAVYGKVLILLLIILFLQWRPKGLFADKGRIADE